MSDEIDTTELNYPEDAAAVRDLVREMLRSQVDTGSSMDTGGGAGAADLWVSFGGNEYVITVKFSQVKSRAVGLAVAEAGLAAPFIDTTMETVDEEWFRKQGLPVPTPRKDTP